MNEKPSLSIFGMPIKENPYLPPGVVLITTPSTCGADNIYAMVTNVSPEPPEVWLEEATEMTPTILLESPKVDPQYIGGRTLGSIVTDYPSQPKGE